jgi:hypothetical protein
LSRPKGSDVKQPYIGNLKTSGAPPIQQDELVLPAMDSSTSTEGFVSIDNMPF